MINNDSHDIRVIKKCFWIFFFFLLTEGIFRRWLLPGLNNIFLVIRDPFVCYAVFLGLKNGLIKGPYALAMMLIGVINFVTTMVCGHGNFWVMLYGVRISIFYFPFMYLCGRVLQEEDILRVGRILVYMLIPMVALNIVQFFSPQSSFVNVGVGGDESGAGFGGAEGYFRPPGIFTFIAGLTDYYGVTFGFLLYFLLNRAKAQIPVVLLYASLIAYFISIPVTISRTHFVQTVMILFFFMFVALKDRQMTKIIMQIVLVFCLFIPILLMNKDVNLFIDVFMSRFTGANESEGGLGNSAVNRTFGWLSRALSNDVPYWGYGDGIFSNFGLKMVQGKTDMENSIFSKVADSTEMEWGRLVCENGAFIGLVTIFVRLGMSISIFFQSLRKIRVGECLAWCLAPYSIYCLMFGQLKAPYNLGFTALIVICALVAIVKDDTCEVEADMDSQMHELIF